MKQLAHKLQYSNKKFSILKGIVRSPFVLKEPQGATRVKAIEELIAYGHRNIQGTHKTTLEITKADQVTLKGDCIVAVRASKAISDFAPSLKDLLRKPASKVTLRIEVSGLREEVEGFGDPRLQLTSREDIVCRKSNFACGRTLMVKANKAATDMDQRVIEELRIPANKASITISVEY